MDRYHFHGSLKTVPDFAVWNQLPEKVDNELDPESKKAVINDIVGHVFYGPKILEPLTSQVSFADVADKVVTDLESKASYITKEDVETIKKLKVIFLSRFPQNDTRIGRLSALEAQALPRESQASKIAHDFAEVTRYLPNCPSLLEQASLRGRNVAALCQNLEKADFKSIIEDYKEELDLLPIDALKAFHDGQITMEQFSTLIFRWSLAKQFPGVAIEQIPFEMAEFLFLNIENCDVQLSEEQKAGFFKNMMLQQPSERVFFMIKESDLDPSYKEADTIAKEVTEGLNLNVFHRVRGGDGEYFRIIPSLSIMQQFLVAYAGEEDACKIVPVIGLSSVEDILDNTKLDTRDMALPFPQVDLPKTADYLPAPKDIDFIKHDFYHSILVSKVPPVMRRAFGELADVILEVKDQEKDPLVKAYLQHLFERIIDMEHPDFRIHPENTPGRNFLLSLSLQEQQAFIRLSRDMEDDPRGLYMVSAELRTKLLSEGNVIGKIVDVLDRRGFCARYGITKEDVERVIQTSTNDLKAAEPHFRELVQECSFLPRPLPPILEQGIVQFEEKAYVTGFYGMARQLALRDSGAIASAAVSPGTVKRQAVALEKKSNPKVS